MFDESKPLVELSFKNSLIQVNENFSYQNWNKNKDYNNYFDNLINYLQSISKETIKDGHDIIHFLMVYMNHNVAKKLLQHKMAYIEMFHIHHETTVFLANCLKKFIII